MSRLQRQETGTSLRSGGRRDVWDGVFGGGLFAFPVKGEGFCSSTHEKTDKKSICLFLSM